MRLRWGNVNIRFAMGYAREQSQEQITYFSMSLKKGLARTSTRARLVSKLPRSTCNLQPGIFVSPSSDLYKLHCVLYN